MPMQYRLKAVLQLEVETILEDEAAPTAETVEFLVQQDLLEAGYACDEIKTLKFHAEVERG